MSERIYTVEAKDRPDLEQTLKNIATFFRTQPVFEVGWYCDLVEDHGTAVVTYIDRDGDSLNFQIVRDQVGKGSYAVHFIPKPKTPKMYP